MSSHTALFSSKFLSDAAKSTSQELGELQQRALPIIHEWQASLRSGALAATKEEQLQSDFLEAFFAKILGYESSRAATVWNLEKEQKNVTDSQKADGALGFFTIKDKALVADVRAVIELKGARSDLDKPQNRKEDKRSPVEQAFAYGSKTGGKCRWVIVSNIVETRLYHVTDQSRYERFELKTLHESEHLRRFLFLLHRARLLNCANPNEQSELDALHQQRKEQERTISNEFYGRYKSARVRLFEHLKERNPTHDELFLLQKAQKLLDRLLFVFFCEDLNLLPRQTAYKVIHNAKQSFSAEEGEIWRQLKGLFTAIDKGNPPNNISKFNGGLFAPDVEMDALSIADSEIESLLRFSEYDFDSDLNVRILGHIFEQSVSDIEELKAAITGASSDAKTGKRKRDGIFYTPEYITRFIVQSTVGAYLEERKQQCGFADLPELTDEDFASISIKKGVLKANKRIEQHIAAWTAYREYVRTVRVCDPACGSGAFLIEVFDFLYAEGQRVNAELSRLRGGQTEVFDLEKHILTQNIFGVDVNAEAVEITKLALWLKTANKGKELTDLDSNIKCGNSLVDDPRVAGAAAFDWKSAFPQVFSPNPSSEHPLPVGEGRGAGGFDVIVGNPPYGAELSQQEQGFLISKFALGSSETAICFIKQGFEMLTAQGRLGYIIPKAFAFASNYAQARAYIWDNLTVLADCRKVWQEVKLEQVIILLSKKKSDRYDSCIRRDTELLSVGSIAKLTSQAFGFFLNGVSNMEVAIAEKMRSSSVMLNDIATNQRGAMLQKHIKMDGNYAVLGGAEIGRMGLRGSKGKIESGTIDDDKAFVKPNSVLVQNIVAHIENPTDHIKIIAALVSDDEAQNIAIVDTINQITIEPAYKAEYIWALLNSKLVNWYVYRFIFSKAVRTMHFDSPVTSRLPIPKVSSEKQQPFITHAETMLMTTRQLTELRKRVLTLLLSKTGIQKASTKLQEWDALTWAELEAEFRKAKVQLSLNEQEELLQYFEQKKAEAEKLKTTLATTDRAIDALVYELYGLTAEEIAVVEGRV
jgi:type I restriction-modification system DNA methylase subunit